MTNSSSITVTVRYEISKRTRVLQRLIRPFRPHLVSPGEPRKHASIPMRPDPSILHSCSVEHFQVLNVYFCRLSNRSQTDVAAHKLLYFPGGGFDGIPSKKHWQFCAAMCERLTAHDVVVVSRPVDPDSPDGVAPQELQAAFRAFLSNAYSEQKSVSLAGDSTGSSVALTLALLQASRREDAFTSALRNLFLISPATDLRGLNPDAHEVDKQDPILSVKLMDWVGHSWSGTQSRDRPGVNPILGDIVSLRDADLKVHAIVGLRDVLAPDAQIFRARCQDVGVQGEWLEWEGQMHCFPLAAPYRLPESVAAKEWFLDVIARNS